MGEQQQHVVDYHVRLAALPQHRGILPERILTDVGDTLTRVHGPFDLQVGIDYPGAQFRGCAEGVFGVVA